ncbi:unnamed protein product [Protopolystoma xenopodis]|uniref:PDEase domain-containing protein n=1 Tax=Protopolystoma xenopodis TaxID=117903 RepID=A0A3S5C1M6_9PLAT|nr:unnamed protein product [Protopolystoma xenopodis]
MSLFLTSLLPCADINSPTKPLKLYLEWTRRIMLEFFKQGDLEKKLKQQISPMCDRQRVILESSQVRIFHFLSFYFIVSLFHLRN